MYSNHILKLKDIEQQATSTLEALPPELAINIVEYLSLSASVNFAKLSSAALFMITDHFSFKQMTNSRFLNHSTVLECFWAFSSIWNIFMGYLEASLLFDSIEDKNFFHLLRRQAISIAVQHFLALSPSLPERNYTFSMDDCFNKSIKNTAKLLKQLKVAIKKLVILKENIIKNLQITERQKNCVDVIIHVMACIINLLQKNFSKEMYNLIIFEKNHNNTEFEIPFFLNKQDEAFFETPEFFPFGSYLSSIPKDFISFFICYKKFSGCKNVKFFNAFRDYYQGKINLSNVKKVYSLSLFNLKNVVMTHANLSSAMLFGVDLRNSDLTSSNLSGAILDYVDLRGANLENADLSGASLNNTQLQNANLKNTDFRGASFSETNFTNTNWEYAKGVFGQGNKIILNNVTGYFIDPEKSFYADYNSRFGKNFSLGG